MRPRAHHRPEAPPPDERPPPKPDDEEREEEPDQDDRDVDGWGPWSEKDGVPCARAPAGAMEGVIALRLHLDVCTELSGPLRVLPGTHNRGILSEAEVERCLLTTDPVDCLVGAGGVLAMRPLIVHSSARLRSDAPRRVLHIEYARSLELECGLRLRLA